MESFTGWDELDTNEDGEVSLEEFEDFLDNMFGCNGKARTNLKAHTGGNGKKKLKKKLKAMEKKAEARRKQTVNQHAKKVVKKKIKAQEKFQLIVEAKIKFNIQGYSNQQFITLICT